MLVKLSFTPAHDDDDTPGSLGASTATHLQQLGKDRTPARPHNACAWNGREAYSVCSFCVYLETPTLRQAIRGRANTRPIAPKHRRSTKPCELPLQSRTRTPNVEKHCPRLVAQGHHLRILSACDVPSLKYSSLFGQSSTLVRNDYSHIVRFNAGYRNATVWLVYKKQGQPGLRAKVFPLAFGISICFGVTTVALVVARSRRVRASLADRIHLTFLSILRDV
jgi:hypothetical protein